MQDVLVSLEAPSMVHADGNPAVMCMIEQLHAHECRMRSVNDLAVGTHVDFTVAIHGAPTIPLQGTIAQRVKNGARIHYVVKLETTPAQADAIARANEIARARAAASVPDIQTDGALTRANVRIPVDFEVRYAVDGATRPARATNVSVGGILMNCGDDIRVGTSLELTFVLGGATIRLHGRVVAHQDASPNYNIAFYDIKQEARDQLARFIASHQK
jgi:hypothetical protein